MWIVVREAELAELVEDAQSDPIANHKMSVLRSMYQAWKGQTVRRVLSFLLLPDGSITGEQDTIVEELT
eukprot:3328707-Amphidinium_carterae.1